jgi:hypothetical protein
VDSIKVTPLALCNLSLECKEEFLINPGYPLFKFTRKTVQLIVCICTFVPCSVYCTLLEFFAVILFRIDHVQLLLFLCFIVILEMYLRYFEPMNNIIMSQ